MTPLTSSTSYCSISRFFAFHDWRIAADAVMDDDQSPRPSKAALLDSTGAYGSVIDAALQAASGEVESACLAGNRYSPTILASLTGVGLAFLEKLVADLGFWRLCQRRMPIGANIENVPGAKLAMETLERLRKGEQIFSFQEAADAGLPDVAEPAESNSWQGDRLIVREAGRFFGTRGRDRSRNY